MAGHTFRHSNTSRGEQYRRRFNRERCVRGERQADMGRLAGQKLQECEHAPMPLLVAPTLANASAQAVHLPRIIDTEPLGSIGAAPILNWLVEEKSIAPYDVLRGLSRLTGNCWARNTPASLLGVHSAAVDCYA